MSDRHGRPPCRRGRSIHYRRGQCRDGQNRPPPVAKPPPKGALPAPVIPKPPPPAPVPPRHVVRAPQPVHHVVHHMVHHPAHHASPRHAVPPLQAPAAPHVSAPPPSPAAVNSALARYAGIMRGIIFRNIVAPNSLRNLGASGGASIEFRVAPDGRILWLKLLRGSDYAAVNQAARAAVSASHFPAFLGQMPRHPITFVIPVRVSGAG